MKHKIGTLLLLFLFGSLPAASAVDSLSIASLTRSLDAAIKVYDDYVARREARIASLKQQLHRIDTTGIDYFRLNGELYREYKAYVCDSALHYLGVNLAWADRHGLSTEAMETRMEQAMLMATAGLYQEAVKTLETIEADSVPANQQVAYYNCARSVFVELAGSTPDAKFRREYVNRAAHFSNLLFSLLPPTSPLCLEMRETQASLEGRFRDALSINDSRLVAAAPNTPQYALVTYQRSRLYRYIDNREEEKRYLMLSALTDLRLAITDHASLWNLAELLYEEGDIERAYRYIRFSWGEVNRFNARSRSLQLAGLLSLIDLTYQAMGEQQNTRLRLYIGLISALSLLLVVAVAYIYRQMKRLSMARNNLEQINEQLHISNHIKEEYIGRFMNLCSVYIKRLDSYRRMVNKKISSGQTEELLKMVRSQDSMETGLKELYDHFDTAFLHLFPDFIEKFNELLLPEERIYPRKGELLSTELRIFALIRLGVDDSSQIAEFLRYSVNTIYNYRAKVKNKACVSRDEFEKRLMKIR